MLYTSETSKSLKADMPPLEGIPYCLVCHFTIAEIPVSRKRSHERCSIVEPLRVLHLHENIPQQQRAILPGLLSIGLQASACSLRKLQALILDLLPLYSAPVLRKTSMQDQ
jgi:hypothetical protein